MAMQNLVAAAAKLATERGDEPNLVADRHRRPDDFGAQRLRLRIQRAWLGKGAVEGPIRRESTLAAKAHHANEPILDGTTAEVLNDMDDLSRNEVDASAA